MLGLSEKQGQVGKVRMCSGMVLQGNTAGKSLGCCSPCLLCCSFPVHPCTEKTGQPKRKLPQSSTQQGGTILVPCTPRWVSSLCQSPPPIPASDSCREASFSPTSRDCVQTSVGGGCTSRVQVTFLQSPLTPQGSAQAKCFRIKISLFFL